MTELGWRADPCEMREAGRGLGEKSVRLQRTSAEASEDRKSPNWARRARLSVMLTLLIHWLGQPWGGVASASTLRDQRCGDWPPLC